MAREVSRGRGCGGDGGILVRGVLENWRAEIAGPTDVWCAPVRGGRGFDTFVGRASVSVRPGTSSAFRDEERGLVSSSWRPRARGSLAGLPLGTHLLRLGNRDQRARSTAGTRRWRVARSRSFLLDDLGWLASDARPFRAIPRCGSPRLWRLSHRRLDQRPAHRPRSTTETIRRAVTDMAISRTGVLHTKDAESVLAGPVPTHVVSRSRPMPEL